MPVVKLNARNITTLPPIGGVRTDYRDELLPGFFLRVTPQGTRTFGIVYTTRDGRLRRCTLGPVGPLFKFLPQPIRDHLQDRYLTALGDNVIPPPKPKFTPP